MGNGTKRAIRYTRLHKDGSLSNALRFIEKKLNLPHGSVQFVNPGGRKARTDSTVGGLRRRWQR
jgi:hypothetical protein